MYRLKAQSHFDSAHFLTDYNGKCENLHGHRWSVEAVIEVDKLIDSGDEKGMVCDFSAFKKAVKEVADEFDHCFLVEEGSLSPDTISALESETFRLKILPYRTTAENLAKDIADILISRGLPIKQVEVDETPNNKAIYIVDRDI